MGRSVFESKRIDPESLSPIEDYILLKIPDRNRVSEAGLLLVGGEKTARLIGEVVAIGPGATDPDTGARIPSVFHIGDWALCMDYMGQEMNFDGHRYQMVREHGFWAKCQVVQAERLELTSCMPLNDYVLLKREENETLEGGRIILNPDRHAAGAWGKVIAVGNGRRMPNGERIGVAVRPQDRVAFIRHAGAVIKIRKEEYRLVSEGDIYGVCEDE